LFLRVAIPRSLALSLIEASQIYVVSSPGRNVMREFLHLVSGAREVRFRRTCTANRVVFYVLVCGRRVLRGRSWCRARACGVQSEPDLKVCGPFAIYSVQLWGIPVSTRCISPPRLQSGAEKGSREGGKVGLKRGMGGHVTRGDGGGGAGGGD
jgi:hypothetical protein